MSDGVLLADGFDEALLGFGRQYYDQVAIYDYSHCVQILIDRDGMAEEEAHEFMEYNVLGAWVGDNTPVFLIDKVETKEGQQ